MILDVNRKFFVARIEQRRKDFGVEQGFSGFRLEFEKSQREDLPSLTTHPFSSSTSSFSSLHLERD